MSSAQHRVLRVGLTGGIASGKSAAADIFEELGATVIDTDIIAREVVAPGQAGFKEVIAAFGPELILPDGSLDRAALRTMIFKDQSAKQQLESILHPLIRTATEAQAKQSSVKASYQILVVPLLIEAGFNELVDRVLVIDCPVNIQQQRVMARDQCSAEEALAVIHSQAGRKQRLAGADDVIVNDAALPDLRAEVERLHAHYLTLAEA